MDIKPFTGFTDKTIQFLIELGFHNHKTWFDENRGDYRTYVAEPFKSLTVAMLPYLCSIDPLLEVNNPHRMISRINRDIRFSKDKSPYRNNVWITFKRPSLDWKANPCFFFELCVDSYRYGMGFYSASRDTMDNLRTYIDQKPKAFRGLTLDLQKNGAFELQGEAYKRKRKEDVPEEFVEWYQKKEVYLTCNRPIDELLFSPNLPGKVAEDLVALKAFYELFWKIKDQQ